MGEIRSRKWPRHLRSQKRPRQKPPPVVERNPKRSGLRENHAASSRTCACLITPPMIALEGGPQLQGHHSINRLRSYEDPWFIGSPSIKELHEMGKIKLLVQHSSQMVYTRAIAVDDDAEEEETKPTKKGKNKCSV